MIVVASQSPTALKVWIANELRRLREHAGIQREQAAERIGKTAKAIGHLETARNLPSPGDVEHLLHLYGHPDRVEGFRDLIRQAKRGRDWWINFGSVVPSWFSLYLGLESTATQLLSFDALTVPGILQTPAYAEAVIRAGGPALHDDEVARRVELRVQRQTVLDRAEQPLRVWTVIAEHVLRAPVGGHDVLADQLDHLRRLAERPTVDVQVLPTAVGGHTGLDGTFTLLTFPSVYGADLGTVYVEDRHQGHYYEDADTYHDYRDALTRLQVAALSQADSTTVLERIAQEVRQ